MEKYFESNRDAEMIALLLSGDQETLLSLSHLVDNWFELVPAYALFIRPYAALSDLHEIAKVFVKHFFFISFDKTDRIIKLVRIKSNISRLSNN